MEFRKAAEECPMLDKTKFKTKIFGLYGRTDICTNNQLIDLLNILLDNNLESAFSETVEVVKILITLPMLSAETEMFLNPKKSKNIEL